MPAPASKFRTYRFGPKNKRLPDPVTGVVVPSAYPVLVEYDQPLAVLLEKNAVDLVADTSLVTPENFPWRAVPPTVVEFELFDFSFRSDYGRSGVDEAFIRDKLEMAKYRPATLPELICLAGHLRETYGNEWYPAQTIIALGAVLTVTEVARKGGWFRKEVRADRRCYPELQTVSGRPRDLLTLSATELGQDGNWPNETLFLAAPA
jgi:hypothetical protein